MTGVLSKTQLRLVAIFMALAAIFGATSVVAATPAQAAQGMSVDCSLYPTNSAYVQVSGSYIRVNCGTTYGASSANGITRVRVDSGPYCVYFGNTLAGCAAPGVSRDVSNRSGQYGRIVPQNPASR